MLILLNVKGLVTHVDSRRRLAQTCVLLQFHRSSSSGKIGFEQVKATLTHRQTDFVSSSQICFIIVAAQQKQFNVEKLSVYQTSSRKVKRRGQSIYTIYMYLSSVSASKFLK